MFKDTKLSTKGSYYCRRWAVEAEIGLVSMAVAVVLDIVGYREPLQVQTGRDGQIGALERSLTRSVEVNVEVALGRSREASWEASGGV